MRDLAKKVADAPKTQQIGRIAGVVVSELDELADHPGDQQRAKQVEHRLERAAKSGREARMKTVFSIALGILAAIGGFVDIGDLVFNTAAGAKFGYQLLWVVAVGVVGIIVYSEMCGRVAAVSNGGLRRVRERLGFGRGSRSPGSWRDRQSHDARGRSGRHGNRSPASLGPAVSDADRAGVAVLAVVIWATPFEWIERIFGYGGLCLLVFAVAAIKLHPDWGAVGEASSLP